MRSKSSFPKRKEDRKETKVSKQASLSLPSTALPHHSKMPTLASFNAKLSMPCKKLPRFLKLYKRPISIRAFKFRFLHKAGGKESNCRTRFRMLRWMLRPWRRSDDIDKVGELRSMTERVRAPCPLPITPAYIKMARLRKADFEEGPNEVEEACRSFENYLVEMIVEGRKVRDLKDVEELLYCWNSLKSPIFVELVSRFYGELCKELFSSRECEVTDDTCVNSRRIRSAVETKRL